MKTERITINDLDQQHSDILCAAEILRKGGLVVFPTETVYGLGGNGLNADAAKKYTPQRDVPRIIR